MSKGRRALAKAKAQPKADERFFREYCGKCGRKCKVVDESRLRVTDSGDTRCTRYICAALEWEW